MQAPKFEIDPFWPRPMPNTGSAPDLGTLEVGRLVPQHGPRSETTDTE